MSVGGTLKPTAAAYLGRRSARPHRSLQAAGGAPEAPPRAPETPGASRGRRWAALAARRRRRGHQRPLPGVCAVSAACGESRYAGGAWVVASKARCRRRMGAASRAAASSLSPAHRAPAPIALTYWPTMNVSSMQGARQAARATPAVPRATPSPHVRPAPRRHQQQQPQQPQLAATQRRASSKLRASTKEQQEPVDKRAGETLPWACSARLQLNAPTMRSPQARSTGGASHRRRCRPPPAPPPTFPMPPPRLLQAARRTAPPRTPSWWRMRWRPLRRAWRMG